MKIYFKNKVIMKTNIKIKKFVSLVTLITLIGSNFLIINTTNAASSKIVYPVKQVSKLDCRYTEFDELSNDCKQSLPILKTKDYTKYIKLNWGYNDYTRYYTELWGASYKYGWDVWFWWHQGTDIVSSKWTPIYAIAEWKVTVAKKLLGWGNTITIEHKIEWKKIFSNYSHLSEILVKVWDKIKVWWLIWKMWSTGNSTWNHLHLQIDLDTPFHPFYYSRTTCPYSYSEITENWVCFDDLKANTIDPLLFLETNWEIVKKLNITTNKVSRVTNPTKVYDSSKNYDTDWVTKSKTKVSNISIFSKTVYIGYPKSDVREVQQILRDIDLYNWDLSWDYRDIENIIYKFQLSKNIVENKQSLWAGRFGPKTRAAIKVEYDKFLKSWNKHNYVVISWKSTTSNVNTWIVTQKIERKHLLTREELEKREYDNFVKSNEFNLNLKNIWWNIEIWETANIDFSITKKYKDKLFKWNTPLDITIEVDNNILNVFPKKFYNFTNWPRKIKLTWLKSWTTNVKIKFWNTTIKTYKIRVYSNNEKIYLDSAIMYWDKNVILWDNVKWIALFKDNKRNKLVNIEYAWTYKIEWIWDTKVCIKKWSIRNISRIYKRECRTEEYFNEISFNYDDTVWWILIYDYKSTWKDAKIKITNTYNNAKIAEKKLIVSNPKWLKSNYAYHNDVISVLENEIATNSSRWYFLENRSINEYDAKIWIRNTLNKIKDDTYDNALKNNISKKIVLLNSEIVNKNKNLTRQEFLEKSYKYLNFNNSYSELSKNYRDLNEDLNKKVIVLFDESTTWKDQFWEKYFQPDKKLTRWEAAYLLNQVLIRQSKTYLTSR